MVQNQEEITKIQDGRDVKKNLDWLKGDIGELSEYNCSCVVVTGAKLKAIETHLLLSMIVDSADLSNRSVLYSFLRVILHST